MTTLKQILPGIFEINGQLATLNMAPGHKVYGEKLIEIDGKEYRFWDPTRSKVGAAVKKGAKGIQISEGSRVLYLGAAEGTTISHLSDIVGKSGIIFGVDISARSMRKFIYLCEQRANMVPILSDANQPQGYLEYIERFSIDVLFQDVSQKNQAEIFLKNARTYLKGAGYGFLAVKARSISSSESVENIVADEAEQLRREFEILQIINLEPFEKEHAMIVCRKK